MNGNYLLLTICIFQLRKSVYCNGMIAALKVLKISVNIYAIFFIDVMFTVIYGDWIGSLKRMWNRCAHYFLWVRYENIQKSIVVLIMKILENFDSRRKIIHPFFYCSSQRRANKGNIRLCGLRGMTKRTLSGIFPSIVVMGYANHRNFRPWELSRN